MKKVTVGDYVKFSKDGENCVATVKTIKGDDIIVTDIVNEDGDEFEDETISNDEITAVMEAKQVSFDNSDDFVNEYTFELSYMNKFVALFGLPKLNQLLKAFLELSPFGVKISGLNSARLNEANQLVVVTDNNIEAVHAEIFAQEFEIALRNLTGSESLKVAKEKIASGIYENDFTDEDLETFHTLLDKLASTNSVQIARNVLQHLGMVAPKIVSRIWYEEMISLFDFKDNILDDSKEFVKVLRSRLT